MNDAQACVGWGGSDCILTGSILYWLGMRTDFPQEEKEQLIEYRSTVASLVGRAKTVVQLRPRSTDTVLGNTTPIKAICDYRQIEVRYQWHTLYRMNNLPCMFHLSQKGVFFQWFFVIEINC